MFDLVLNLALLFKINSYFHFSFLRFLILILYIFCFLIRFDLMECLFEVAYFILKSNL
jgi:hypothetical protein